MGVRSVLMGFIFRFVDSAVFMLDQYFVRPPKGSTCVVLFILGGEILRQVPEEECTFPSLVGIDARYGITGAVELRHNCIDFFAMFESGEPHIHNMNNTHR